MVCGVGYEVNGLQGSNGSIKQQGRALVAHDHKHGTCVLAAAPEPLPQQTSDASTVSAQ